MKKIIAILLLLMVAACSSTTSQSAVEKSPQVASEAAPQVKTETTTPQPAQAEAAPAEPTAAPVKTDLFDIESAFTTGAPVKCTTTQDGQTVTLYFQSGKTRMDTVPADAHAIYDSDRIYMWTASMGTTMKMEDVKKMQGAAGQAPKSPQEIAADARKPNMKCESATPPADAFTPPANVQFQDLAAIMAQLGTQMPQGQ